VRLLWEQEAVSSNLTAPTTIPATCRHRDGREDALERPVLSRRNFLNLVGRAGGAAALYHTMAAMGLLAVPETYAGSPELPPDLGKGRHVIVLGAGIAGMTAAYELGRAGFRCTILEARDRAGGRNWTIRHGTRVEEVGADGRTVTQLCRFDRTPELYFNAGPARLPQHHHAILAYCRTLGVPLEPMVNDNHNALAQSDRVFDGQPKRIRQLNSDARGYIAELLAKAVSQKSLDTALSADDRERFLAMLRNFGALDKQFRYRGSGRAGYVVAPGAGNQAGESSSPLPLDALIRSPFAQRLISFPELYDFAPTMLQPVGGMDRIAAAFARRLKSAIRYGAEVREIRKRGGQGVRIVYRDRKARREHAIEGDCAVCTLPVPLLATLRAADFSAERRAAIAQTVAQGVYAKAVKIALQAESRFWEMEDHIYGGISWTDQDITQIWYPSAAFNARKGVLVGAYIWTNAIGDRVGRLSPEARAALAAEQGAKLHPSYVAHVGRGISVAWHNIPYNRGAWADWDEAQRGTIYQTLIAPDGPIHFAGEHLSHLTGWQEGAILSAHAAVKAIGARIGAP
jgi:monoamine oxidase